MKHLAADSTANLFFHSGGRLEPLSPGPGPRNEKNGKKIWERVAGLAWALALALSSLKKILTPKLVTSFCIIFFWWIATNFFEKNDA